MTYETGAHSGRADLLGLDPTTGITELDSVTSDSDGLVLSDLNGDGLIDVSAVNSTDQPDFADAPKYWMTELNEGDHFVRTGCTAPLDKDSANPAPTAPVTGPCPAF